MYHLIKFVQQTNSSSRSFDENEIYFMLIFLKFFFSLLFQRFNKNFIKAKLIITTRSIQRIEN